ncbi:MAG: orotidine-5'-phosphate decarboxylase [Elusimicrobiota bacterium]
MNITELIVALDVDTITQEEELLETLKGTVTYFKVGLRLFTSHGKRAVELVHRYGAKVFLDLKLHDIPQAVEHAVHEVQKMRVYAVSLHLSGGADMIHAAASVYPRPKLWGVSVLTSLSATDLHVIHPKASLRPMALRLARMGLAHKIDGVICSGLEVPSLKKALGPETCFITPGIRPAGHSAHDQKRHITPGEAARLGIRYAVVGRPVTKEANPLAAAQEILTEMRNAA